MYFKYTAKNIQQLQTKCKQNELTKIFQTTTMSKTAPYAPVSTCFYNLGYLFLKFGNSRLLTQLKKC